MTTDREALSGFADSANRTQIQPLARTGLGQSYPRHYPGSESPLGTPLSIRDVARLIGRSVRTAGAAVPSG